MNASRKSGIGMRTIPVHIYRNMAWEQVGEAVIHDNGQFQGRFLSLDMTLDEVLTEGYVFRSLPPNITN